jgi:predicted DsbA family dithiol-disulfide isomerase
MKVEFYRTLLCPRCLLVAHELKRLQREFPHLEIETIEVATNLVRVREAKVRTVPALKVGDAMLTGFLLTPAKIRRFLLARV